MNSSARELIDFLREQTPEPFQVTRMVQPNRLLPRQFPEDLPLSLHYQGYPGHREMVGENWLHWHDYYELFVAAGGGGVFTHGTERHAFETGDILLADPLKLHGVHRMDPTHAALVIVFPMTAIRAASPALEGRYLAAWDRRVPDRAAMISASGKKAARADERLWEAMLAISKLWFSKDREADWLVDLHGHFLTLLRALTSELGDVNAMSREQPVRQSSREEKLRRVLDHIAAHAGEPLAQADVAAVAGMSVSRFRAFFKETTGWRFDHYLRDVRLENAARLLRESHQSVGEIAHATGFADQSHLQRQFKTRYEMSPLRYRKHEIAGE